MPTTYSIPIAQRGHEIVSGAIVVSDTYNGLTAAATTVSGILKLGPSKKDLDVKLGQQGVDQLELTLDGTASQNSTDEAAVAFVLDAQGAATDELKKRYVAWILDPSDPIESDDFEFRGIIEPKMSGSGSDWKDAEYGVTPDPDYIWKISATSLEVEDLLEKKLEDLVSEIATDSDWVTANVRDALGWFYEAAAEDYGHREGRYGSMVGLHIVLQRLLDEATDGHPVDVTLLDSDLGVSAHAGNFVGLTTERSSGFLGLSSEVVNFRYGDPAIYYPEFEGGTLWDPPNGSTGELPYQVRGAADIASVHLSDCEISWRLLTPRSEVKAISWLAYDTLGGLLYRVAYALGGWIEWTYVNTTTLHCQILTRKELSSKTKIYPTDSTVDDIDVMPNDSSSRKAIYPAGQFAEEGLFSSYYYQDGSWGPPRAWSGRSANGPSEEGTGPPVALTIAPTVAVLYDKSMDADVEFHDEYHLAPMPHNGVFYRNPTTPENPDFPGADLIDLHTALYIRFTAPADDICIGCENKEVVRPVQLIAYEHEVNGSPRPAVAQWIASYLADLGKLDKQSYKAERRISVPYLTRFRTSPGGTDDWRHCRVGNIIELDGTDYQIIGIERDWESSTTKLRLHDTSRFAFSESAGAPPDPPPTSFRSIGAGSSPQVGRAAYPAAGPIPRFAAVIADGYGHLHAATADGYSYGRVLGIALNAASAGGDRVEIATGGFVNLDDEYFSAGDSVYLRNLNSNSVAVANLSAVHIRDSNTDETLHQVIATAMTTRRIRIEIGRSVYVREDVPEIDFSTLGAGGGV